MKLRHRLTATILLVAFATTTALPAAGIPNLKTAATIKAATPPRMVAPPRNVALPKPPTVKTPVVPKGPNVPREPVVRTPAAPKIPAIKTPVAPRIVKAPVTTKMPAIKTPAIVSSPKGVRGTKTPVTVKAPAQPAIVKAPVSAKPAPVFTPGGKSSSKDSGNTLDSITTAPPPDTRVTVQGGNSSSNASQNTSSNTEATEMLVDQLQSLGFSEAEAQKIAAQLQDPATRAAAQKIVEGKSSAEATRQMIEGLVGEEQAEEVARRLTNPATRAATEQNLKLVVEMASNLQLTGVSLEKADRVAVNLIRNGVTDPKIINEIAGRLIATDVLGVPPPPPADTDDPNAPTALDLIKVAINVRADLEAIGATGDREEVKKATEEILKNRITDPKKIKEILEKAASPILEEQGLPPGKPGESLQDRLNKFAEQQKAELEASKPKKDAPKKPNKPAEGIGLGASFKGRLGRLFGHKPGEGGPPNPNGRSPSLTELVFGTTQPRKGGPRGVKDGKFTVGGLNGGQVGGTGAGQNNGNGGKGGGGVVGGPNGNIPGRQGDQDQGVGTGTSPARDPDPSPVRDPNRDPNQPDNGDPNGTGGRGGDGLGGPADPNATGNAQVPEQDLPDSTNPQQSGGATNPAGSNMDTNNGTFTVTSDPTQNADGTTTVGFSVSGSPGGENDGNYETTYYPDGTYVTNRINENGDPEYVGEGNGTPPAVKAGDSTNVTNGDQAVFAGNDGSSNSENTGNNSDGSSSSNSSGGNSGGNNGEGGENSSDSSNSDDSSNNADNSNGDSGTQGAGDDDSAESSAGRPAPDGEGRRSAKDAANDPEFWSRVSALFGKKSGGDPNTTNPGRGDNENPVFDRSIPITDKKAGLIGNPTGTNNRPRPAVDASTLPAAGNTHGNTNPDRNDNQPPSGEDKSRPLPPKPGGGV